MQKSFQAIASRMDRAEDDFISLVREATGCTEQDARKVMKLYSQHRIARLDIGIGRIHVKHGAYMEPATLHRAIAMAK